MISARECFLHKAPPRVRPVQPPGGGTVCNKGRSLVEVPFLLVGQRATGSNPARDS